MLFAPIALPLPNGRGGFDEDIIAYYEARAKGGVGGIITGAMAVDPVFGTAPFEHHVTEPYDIAPLEKLVRTVHKYDARIYITLSHKGGLMRQAEINGRHAVSASSYFNKYGEETRALSKEEIHTITEHFSRGAVFAKQAGADGIELGAGHGYLYTQFLSPRTNRRTDEYGGCLENRCRFLLETVRKIKAVCGPGFAVIVRFSLDEFVDGGFSLEDGLATAKLLEDAEADAIDITVASQDNGDLIREPPSYRQGWRSYISAAVKAAVTIPVISVNTIKRPEFAEKLLREGACDFVALGRALLADPAWCKKAKDGHTAEIRSCISCLYCHQNIHQGKIIKCTVNPELMREREFSEFVKDGDGRPAVVVGGGPAGLECARVLALRGFSVTLLEESTELGGQLKLAEAPPNKEKITWLKQGLIAQVRAAGVQVRTGSAPSPEEIRQLNPVGVFLCNGSEPIIPRLPIDPLAKLTTVPEVLSGSIEIENKTVVVVGSGMSGLETALFLGHKGNQIKLVDMADKPGPGMHLPLVADVLHELELYSPEFFMSHRLVEICPDGVIAQGPDGQRFLSADYTVLALGVRPRKDIQNLLDAFPDANLIGDAEKSGRIAEAIEAGFIKAWCFCK